MAALWVLLKGPEDPHQLEVREGEARKPRAAGDNGHLPETILSFSAIDWSYKIDPEMKWITRERVKVDRVACPWLIRNFVDREAEFVFLPHETEWSAISDGTVYDVPDCELGHHGEDVSFNSILKKYQLNDAALILLGEIVRAADSKPRNPHLAGEGLRWIASGFSALGFTDDEILQREFVVYDALYAECKRRLQGT